MHIPAPASAATANDHAFIVDMARHACIIEDWPLPDPDDDEVLEMLPPPGVIPIIAEDRSELPVGAAWTYYSNPPLRSGADGAPLPELCIGVAPGRRGGGVGGLLLDALFADLSPHVEMMCTNVHVRNPADHGSAAQAVPPQQNPPSPNAQVFGRGQPLSRHVSTCLRDVRS